MRLRQSNHRLQLSSGRGDSSITRARIRADIPHFDVGLDERVRRFLGEDGVYSITSERNVGGECLDRLSLSQTSVFRRESAESRTNENVDSSSIGSVLQVESNKMTSESSIVDLVNLVQNEIEQIESRDERRREIDISRDRPLEVVL